MMSISWTTLQEQILAKLRGPYRSEANMNEFVHGVYLPVLLPNPFVFLLLVINFVF
jgi:hypothetical protein